MLKLMVVTLLLNFSLQQAFASADDHASEPAKEEKSAEQATSGNGSSPLTKKEIKLACKNENKRGKELLDCINERLEIEKNK